MSMPTVGDITSGPTAESEENNNYVNQGIVSDISLIDIISSQYLQCQ